MPQWRLQADLFQGVHAREVVGDQQQSSNYDQIMVTGHADCLRSAEYDQKLSERPADTVHPYLLSKNIAPSKISVSGQGASPETAADACTGLARTPLSACSQPDRRVDVEMQGTRAATVAP